MEKEIEKEFNSSETPVKNLDKEDEEKIIIEMKPLETWRMILLFVIVFSGAILFHKYLPIQIISLEKLKEYYQKECCSYIFNSTKCSFSSDCEEKLTSLIRYDQLNETLHECCYWFGRYSKTFNGSLFCSPECLSNFF